MYVVKVVIDKDIFFQKPKKNHCKNVQNGKLAPEGTDSKLYVSFES